MCDNSHLCSGVKGLQINDEGQEKQNILFIEQKVKDWWLDLQKERKCNTTNSVSKVVNKAPADVQDRIRQLISEQIDSLILQTYSTKRVQAVQITCNAINGCFDNFVHSTDAVKLSFKPVLLFIDFGIDVCRPPQVTGNDGSLTSKVVELIHSLSRILVLVLKLRRTQVGSKKRNDNKLITVEKKELIEKEVLVILKRLLVQISPFLIMEDVSMDTKNNFAMSGILIREISRPNQDLIQFHESFVKSLPSKPGESLYNLNILKFVMSSAIVNTWSVNIINPSSTAVYLKFFVGLCESYSSDTPVILNSCRALVLLIKHDCFKTFTNEVHSNQLEQSIEILLPCVWMLLEHPVACVRHSAKDFLQVLVTYPQLQSKISASVNLIPCEKRSYFIGMAALANEIGSRSLIETNKLVPEKLLGAIRDPTIVSHVSFALECLILQDELAERDICAWCETWIIPLLESLSNVLPIAAADIEKILEKTFKKYPSAVLYIIDKWGRPKDGKELRNVLTCLKISHKQGHQLRTSLDISTDRTSSDGVEDKLQDRTNFSNGAKWKNLIDVKLLYFCLHHGEDDIRISAFTLIIESRKTTETYSHQDFRFIQYFLNYNLNNQQPATRQRILGLVRKMLVRFSDSRATLIRSHKNNKNEEGKLNLYDSFRSWLIQFCFNNIFPGANFNRLNTVVNILLLYFDNLQDSQLNVSDTNLYWEKIVIVLESSYEENKELAVRLSKKLNYKYLDDNEPNALKCLYLRALDLCSHMEPPDVLTGSYLLLALLDMPASQQVLSEIHRKSRLDVQLQCIEVLLKRLEGQLRMGKKNLMRAAVSGPMYGTLFAIRLVLRAVDFSEMCVDGTNCANLKRAPIEEWHSVLNELIDICFDMAELVSCVVNSSSPEGHLPMDFQSNLENLLSGSLKLKESGATERQKECERRGSCADAGALQVLILSTESQPTEEILEKHGEEINHKLNKLMESMDDANENEDLSELMESLKTLLTENECWKQKVKQMDVDESCESLKVLRKQNDILTEQLSRVERQARPFVATAQVLLLCSWRSIKESCLYLGDLVSKLPIETANPRESDLILESYDLPIYSSIAIPDLCLVAMKIVQNSKLCGNVSVKHNLLTEERLVQIGDRLRTLLCEIKHRGAFEQAYIAFRQLVNALWRCSNKNLSLLPQTWLEQILSELKSPFEKTINLCLTRRSAGLPFMIQAIICSEVQSSKSVMAHNFHMTLKTLLEITEDYSMEMTDSRIHALNILRALFKHAQLGELVAPYVSKALMSAVRGSRASSWSERNSSSLLFSSLMIRIFGVSRSRDEISKKNRMTSRTFFQRYPDLYEFLLSEMDLVCQKKSDARGHEPKPSLYLVLLVLGRLYPSSTEDIETIDLSMFLPYIDLSCCNSTMKVRELAARALVPLISHEQMAVELDQRFYLLSFKQGVSQNQRHGVLLQIKALIGECFTNSENSAFGSFAERCEKWIKNTKWMLSLKEEDKNGLSSSIVAFYVQVLHLMFKHCSHVKHLITDLVTHQVLTDRMKILTKGTENHIPGTLLLLHSFYYLKMDALAEVYLPSASSKVFFDFFMSTLSSRQSEVKAIPLSFLHFVLLGDEEEFDDSDVDTCAAPIKDLSCFSHREKTEKVKVALLESSWKITSHILTNLDDSVSSSKLVHRLWFLVAGQLATRQEMNLTAEDLLNLKSMRSAVTNGDNNIANSGVLCYGIFLKKQLLNRSKAEEREQIWSDLMQLLNKNWSSEVDIRLRIAVAKLINLSWKCFLIPNNFSNPNCSMLCMLPIKQMGDAEVAVRHLAMQLAHTLQNYVISTIPETKRIVRMEPVTSNMALLPLKAQESLLDCYINLFGSENIFHLVLPMILCAASAWTESRDADSAEAEQEVGVFEKGNPNPFTEDLSLSNLFCNKLRQIRSSVDLKSVLLQPFKGDVAISIRDLFKLGEADEHPRNLLHVTKLLQDKSFSNVSNLARTQIKELINALDVEECCLQETAQSGSGLPYFSLPN